MDLDNKVNECSLHLDDTKFDNYTKEFELTFDFRGELHDVDIIQEKNYYVYCDAIIANNESPYWCSLVVQAILFQKEKKFREFVSEKIESKESLQGNLYQESEKEQ